MTISKYKRDHVRWMEDRFDGISDDEEAEHAAKLDDIWETLSLDERASIETWHAEQIAYREAHGMSGLEKGAEYLTPGERAAVEFQGEYELILAEGDHKVIFQVSGREVEISRGTLLEYDEKGRFWVTREDAEALGLIQ